MNITLDKVLKDRERTRHWLSVKTGIAYTTIVRMASNKSTTIDLKVLEKICKVLECTPNDILEIDELI